MNEATAVFYQQTILPSLSRLDGLLEDACQTAQLVTPAAGEDRFRGLYVNQAEIDRLLSQSPGHPHLWSQNGHSSPKSTSFDLPSLSPLAWLSRTCHLTPFDCDVLLLALAPEIDRRYERIYAFLQDHVARKRPSVDLALNLLCADALMRLEQRQRFAPDAPLRQHGLIHLLPERDSEQPSLLAHTLKVDPLVVQLLLGQPQLDERLALWADYATPLPQAAPLTLPAETAQRLRAVTESAQANQTACCLHFYGPPGTNKHQTAVWLAAHLQTPLLEINLQRLRQSGSDWREPLRIALRQQHFQRCLLLLSPVDAVTATEFSLDAADLMALIAEAQGVLILAGSQPFLPQGEQPLTIIPVPFAVPTTEMRRHLWHTHLQTYGLAADETTCADLAVRFRLTSPQIETAVRTARTQADWQQLGEENGLETAVTPHQLFAAARHQCGHDLAALAQKITPLYTWADIVLPEETKTQLHEICRRVACRYQVLHQWGFDSKLSLGKGTNALFSGPSGTGKTMAAEIVARELGLDLYKIDLSGVVSKYIGETEKNLDRIFRAAENANAILFFDEADALFGKRSEVRDSHDRYANIEISYLLQKMEEYPGLTILATNLRQNLDDAFVRRLAFMVHFPFPDESSRQQIWQGVWPQQTPLHTEVDLDLCARRFKLSGGSIKNMALAAAFLAADEDAPVSMTHLYQAARREYQKMGKAISLSEIESET
ncbi:MAG: ATP-binding protein [Anaerolineae bacterium]|nr:ATP-binding protein [Anaerolineae bacterium]